MIKQLIIKVNQIISIPTLINTKNGIIVEEYEFIKQEVIEADINSVMYLKVVETICFILLKKRCIDNIKFVTLEKRKEGILTITHG